jgi:hypothetical protein
VPGIHDFVCAKGVDGRDIARNQRARPAMTAVFHPAYFSNAP